MKLLKTFTLRSIVGEDVLVPVGDTAKEFSGMISLTPTAALIWKNIEQVETVEQLVDIILEEYEADRETIERDVLGFVGMLKEQGMID